MDFEGMIQRYMEKLLDGDRVGCREVLGEALQTGTPANTIYTELFWPVMAKVEKLFRENRIDRITENMATRINRTLVDQLQSKLPHREQRGLKMIIVCADEEPEELGAQMCADLFESDGWDVKFLGGNVPNDEVTELAGRDQTDMLFIYGTKPTGAPNVRKLIDKTRSIGACPNMRIMVSGGIFNRAEGLWEEIGADLFAPTAKDALEEALSENRHVEDTKRRKRKPINANTLKVEEVVMEALAT